MVFCTPANAPEILSPVEGSTFEDTDVDLKVKVTDPTADKMKVQLYEGFKYLQKDDNITTYANTSLTEPPKQVISDNDQIITEEEKISETDSEYLEISATGEFPCHRFEVDVDETDGQTRSDVQLFTTGTKSGNSQGGGNLSSNGNNSEQKDNKMKNLMNY